MQQIALNQAVFYSTVLNSIKHEKTESVSISVRITTWFSVIKQLSSVELASDQIFLFVRKKYYFNKVMFAKIKAWSCSGLFWLS